MPVFFQSRRTRSTVSALAGARERRALRILDNGREGAWRFYRCEALAQDNTADRTKAKQDSNKAQTAKTTVLSHRVHLGFVCFVCVLSVATTKRDSRNKWWLAEIKTILGNTVWRLSAQIPD